MKGTWQTDDHGAAGGGLVLLVIGALMLISSGAAAALTAAVVIAFIAAAAVLVLAVAGFAGYLVYRARRPRAIPRQEGIIMRPLVRRLDAPGQPALEQPAARELHVHFHGADPADVAEILRRHERPE